MKHILYLSIFFIAISVNAQEVFKPQKDAKGFKVWIREAQKAGELDKKSTDRFYEILEEMDGSSTDSNEVFNFGRSIQKALQPGFSLQNHTYSNGAIQLMVQTELAYRFAISNCGCHGRANIMLGMLYNQQEKYTFSEPYLEKGLQLKEGSDDWMVAANQYLLAGAYTNNTKTEKYQAIYKKYKVYAPKHSNPYYSKMANMYVPYYE